MLISFSHPQMRPWIEAGLRQFRGEDVGADRVKRQTIRRMGPRYERILHCAGPLGGVNADLGSLHLWWKSRTPARCALGVVSPFNVRPIEIEHIAANPAEDTFECVEIRLPEFRRHAGKSTFWACTLPEEQTLTPEMFWNLRYADGFDCNTAFKDFFVPKPGDLFMGVLLQW